MPNRKALSNKTRFEVFKRDSFKCQYCGRCAPEVILQVDHITPVAKGGKNEIINLITSCFDCNNGKSDRELSDNSVMAIQKAKLDELNERRVQLDMMIEWKKTLSDKTYELNAVVKYFNEKNNCNVSLTDRGISALKSLMKKYTVEQIIDCINEAHEKYFGSMDIVEMWDRIPRLLNYATATDDDKNKMKFFGAIKARFSNTYGYNVYACSALNKKIRKIYEVIDSRTTTLDYKHLFEILNSNFSYSDFIEGIEEMFDHIFESNENNG